MAAQPPSMTTVSPVTDGCELIRVKIVPAASGRGCPVPPRTPPRTAPNVLRH